MKTKTAELSGAALDWSVAAAHPDYQFAGLFVWGHVCK